MPVSFKEVFKNFSFETTLHGFKRLWMGNILRWPIWTTLILCGIAMCCFQVRTKYAVFSANPLNININVMYKNQLDFPSVTICNTLKIRVSFMVNHSILLNMTSILFPKQNSNGTINHFEQAALDEADQIWNSYDFFEQAGIPKEDLILWQENFCITFFCYRCRLPSGELCIPDDFLMVPTSEGFCFTLAKTSIVKEGGPTHALQMLLNLAEYEKMSDLPPSGIKVIVHENGEDPMPDTGLDVAGGYQTAIVLKKSVTTRLEHCFATNPLRYFHTYSFAACRSESALVSVANSCGCKPYIVPEPVQTATSYFPNASIDTYPNCSLSQHFTCVVLHTAVDATIGSNETVQASDAPSCIGECKSTTYDKELSYTAFRDNLAFKRLIGSDEASYQKIYETGKNGGAFINLLRRMEQEYLEIDDASQSYDRCIAEEKLVPPYGTVADLLLTKLPCLNQLVTNIVKPNGNSSSTIDTNKVQTVISLNSDIGKSLTDLDSNIDVFNVNETLDLAKSTKAKYLDTCADGAEEVCALPALYEMLKIREMISTKCEQADSYLKTKVLLLRNLSLALESSATPLHMTPAQKNQTKTLSSVLKYYLDTVEACLKATVTTYSSIIEKNEQPSLKIRAAYDNFLIQLDTVASASEIYCKNGGTKVGDYVQGGDNRRSLAVHILDLLEAGTKTTTDIITQLQYHSQVVLFVQSLQAQTEFNSYDLKSLNASIYELQSMMELLDSYLKQTIENRMTKSDLFTEIFSLKKQFQEAVLKYKNTVNDRLRALDNMIQDNIDKMLTNYPGDSAEAASLRVNFINSPLADNMSLPIGQITCLKKARPILNAIATRMEADSMDSFQRNFDTLVGSLGEYYQDVKYMKGFYQNNVAFVQIYFRDMGVTETTQERTYDFISFMCDIGGIIGLWLGASMLSVFELLDLLVFEHIGDIFRRDKPSEETGDNNKQSQNDAKKIASQSKKLKETDFYKPLAGTRPIYYH